MILRTLLIGVATLAGCLAPAQAYDMKEPPVLAPLVAEGKLPTVAQRIPENPLVTDLEAAGRKTGRYGGQLRTIFSQEKDVRLMNVYGYARLVGYDEKLELKPDILAAFDVEEDRIFTLHLRKAIAGPTANPSWRRISGISGRMSPVTSCSRLPASPSR